MSWFNKGLTHLPSLRINPAYNLGSAHLLGAFETESGRKSAAHRWFWEVSITGTALADWGLNYPRGQNETYYCDY
jgi:hypothetical protein